MSDTYLINPKEMINDLPCCILKLALDDELTVLSATDAFYKLIDYNKPEKLLKSILNIVYSADIIYYTQQVAEQIRTKDNQLILFFRVLQKSGSLKWIMINGYRTEENHQIKGKSLPIYICMAVDISTHMIEHKKMEQEVENHRTILELSRELFFEYIIATDTLSFSELFREIFGKETTIKNFNKKLEKTKIIHPKDLPTAINTYKSMMNGKKQVSFEMRLITRDGKTVWYICYASIIYDENKNSYKVVGKLSVVNRHEEDETEDSVPKVQYDTLTKVYTKDSAEQLITHSIHQQDLDSLSALLICKVHNYRGINEIARILESENILTSIAGIFKRLLRRTDIIGRTGLGDFVIYMKDIGSERSAYDMAEQICREVNKIYSYEFNKNTVYISIGIAFVKGKSDYHTVSANAKAALALANKNNHSSFEVFYPSLVNNTK